MSEVYGLMEFLIFDFEGHSDVYTLYRHGHPFLDSNSTMRVQNGLPMCVYVYYYSVIRYLYFLVPFRNI